MSFVIAVVQAAKKEAKQSKLLVGQAASLIYQ